VKHVMIAICLKDNFLVGVIISTNELICAKSAMNLNLLINRLSSLDLIAIAAMNIESASPWRRTFELYSQNLKSHSITNIDNKYNSDKPDTTYSMIKDTENENSNLK